MKTTVADLKAGDLLVKMRRRVDDVVALRGGAFQVTVREPIETSTSPHFFIWPGSMVVTVEREVRC